MIILQDETNKANKSVNPENSGKLIAKILNDKDPLHQYQCEYSQNAGLWLVTKYKIRYLEE